MANRIEKSSRIEDYISPAFGHDSAHLVDPIAIGGADGLKAHAPRERQPFRIDGQTRDHDRGHPERARGESGAEANWPRAFDYALSPALSEDSSTA